VRVAVFDLGSTSFQLLVSDVELDGGLTPVLRDRVVLNLGADVAATGRVQPEAVERAAQVVRRFRDLAGRVGAEEVIPVATAAFREAANRPELASVIEDAIGMPLRILSGNLEVGATVAGIRASVVIGGDPWLAFDLGGGSLEIALVEAGAVRWTETFPLGAAWVTASIVRSDPIPRAERRAIKQAVRDELEPARERSGAPREAPCIAAGGTAGALGRLLAAERWPTPPASLNQFEVGVDALTNLARELATLDQDERLALPGIDERRAEILPAGALVLATALAVFGAEAAVHSEWGLREGVLLQEIDAPPPRSPDDLRSGSVDRLARRWGPEAEHQAKHQGWVRRHALELFDETRDLHGLSDRERELLAHGASLHDIGVRISPDKSHRHGAYLVEHGGLRGFSPQEVATMASMIRFHRGAGWPKPSYGPYAGLDAGERQACKVLTGILRIAHGLGRADESDVAQIRTERRGAELLILVSGSANPRGAVAEAEERAGVLERALDRRIRFEIVPEGTLVTRPA
jgi:exopolyphosphatase/guanosine-5'-triphosphate,3'-diphosphate pyrophosphatase